MQAAFSKIDVILSRAFAGRVVEGPVFAFRQEMI
jgi:hypothetical protein